jgi:hypothetical protein
MAVLWIIGEMKYTVFWLENLKVRGHLEELIVDGKIDCIHLPQVKGQYRVLINTVMNFLVQ